MCGWAPRSSARADRGGPAAPPDAPPPPVPRRGGSGRLLVVPRRVRLAHPHEGDAAEQPGHRRAWPMRSTASTTASTLSPMPISSVLPFQNALKPSMSWSPPARRARENEANGGGPQSGPPRPRGRQPRPPRSRPARRRAGARSSRSGRATQPSVGPRSGRARCRKIALPRPRTTGRVVPAQHAHDVVEVVLAPQALVPRRVGQGHLAVVVRVGGVVAPAIRGRDRLARTERPAGGATRSAR
jgi:hypothetical protein